MWVNCSFKKILAVNIFQFLVIKTLDPEPDLGLYWYSAKNEFESRINESGSKTLVSTSRKQNPL
jgi:hypothetical protein